MGSSAPPEDDDDSSNTADVIKVDLTLYQHTGTYYRPNGPAYTFPPPEKFLKSLSRHFNTMLAADQEFHIYNGAEVEFTKLPDGYTVANKTRPDGTLDLEIHGHFLAGNRHFNSGPQFLVHVFDIMRLGQTDWIELRPEFTKKPDGLTCQCALCVKPSAKHDKSSRRLTERSRTGPGVLQCRQCICGAWSTGTV
ncbi:hypothetical protein D6C84_08960 [Aureobasidium pullulans]|uniref:Cryptic loci regulator 2 N-terminal domain-containing protein n=1 Tax=Aureobasidium pullulans TaxID=5580 RepID=A0A4S9XDA4_AURPU|nr:hypothetical protein D6C84_08960 [Aureobasidium pullulans]